MEESALPETHGHHLAVIWNLRHFMVRYLYTWFALTPFYSLGRLGSFENFSCSTFYYHRVSFQNLVFVVYNTSIVTTMNCHGTIYLDCLLKTILMSLKDDQNKHYQHIMTLPA